MSVMVVDGVGREEVRVLIRGEEMELVLGLVRFLVRFVYGGWGWGVVGWDGERDGGRVGEVDGVV